VLVVAQAADVAAVMDAAARQDRLLWQTADSKDVEMLRERL
jgi:hypothetical protein